MGLDQYVFKRLSGEDKARNNDQDLEIFYWRKHYALNDWIAINACPWNLNDFNCEEITLEKKHIDKLFQDIINLKLNKDSLDRESDIDLKFVRKAYEIIDNGEEIYYYAWW